MKIKSLIIILLLSALLVSCRAGPAPEDEPEPEAPATEWPNTFEILSADALTFVSGDSKGCYFVRYISENLQPDILDGPPYSNFYAMAYYTDYAEAVTRPLCNRDHCLHDSPACMAWKDFRMSNRNVVAAQDRLFWISMWYNEAHSIDVSAPDGTGLRRLFAMSESETIVSCLLYDGEVICFVKNTDIYPVSRSLMVIDAESGNLRAEFPVGDRDTLLGLYGNRPLFLQQNMTMTSINTYKSDCLLYTIDLMTGERTDYLAWHANEENGSYPTGAAMLQKEGVLMADNATEELVALDMESGARTVLAKAPPEVSEFYLCDARDGHALVLCRVDGTPNIPYVVDLATGEWTPFALTYRTEVGDSKAVAVVADAGDQYLVLMDCRRYSDGGNPVNYFDTATRYRYVYALIDKDDYWNGAANYQEIELLAS